MTAPTPEPPESPLDTFIRFADKVMAFRAPASPQWSETCACGASVVVGQDSPASLRRTQNQWWGRHARCAERAIEPEAGSR